MVVRLPQQVFRLLVLVTGMTMGISIIYGAELQKSTSSSSEILRKTINRLDEVSNLGFSMPTDDSSNFQTKSFKRNDQAVRCNRESHEKNMWATLCVRQLDIFKNNYVMKELASYLPLTKRFKLHPIPITEEFVREKKRSKETWKTFASSGMHNPFENPPSFRTRRTSGFLVLSSSRPSSLSSPLITSSMSSASFSFTPGDSPSVEASLFVGGSDYPKATLSTPRPSSSADINGGSSNGVVRLQDEAARGSEIDVSSLESESARIPNVFHSVETSKKLQTTESSAQSLTLGEEKNVKASTQLFKSNEYNRLTGNRATPSRLTPATGFAFLKRYRRDGPEDNNCEKFEIGDPVKREFTSPNYPENYPPLTNCVLVLEAEKGMLLKLDFREQFELETKTPDGECRFDYLEVRDGQYGFSPRIGTYCDKTFPPEIISQSRYLWLNFHSDDTIEYQGFKAVWSTVPRPNTGAIPVEQDPCIYHEIIPADFELKSDMIKDAKKLAESNRVAVDCLWVMKAGPSMRMQLTFDSFKLEKPNDCSANFLDVFDGQTDEPSRVKKFCGSIAESLSTRSNVMYIRLYLEQKAINSSFSALITAVRDKDSNQACRDDEYDCDDATCIASTLKCNYRRNCRFQRDEDDSLCGTGLENQDRTRIVIILVIFSLIMFGMCTAFVFNCVRKLRRDHRIIREHIRQSREDRLDEIGRRATPCPLSVSRTDLREGGSESPAGEEVDSSKELIPAATLSAREYTKEMVIQMKYGTKEINDIHQSNNVSNATQERLQESSEEPDMCDSSCQTRESLFAPTISDAILASPGFSTFGYRSSIVAPEDGSVRKGSPTNHPSYRHHHHRHRPSLGQTSEQSQESHRTNSQISGHPASERCSRDGCAQICPKHNPIPAPPGWSLHDPPYPRIVADTSGCPGGIENSYRRYQSPKPDQEPTLSPSTYQQHQYQYPVFTRQNTVGSGERYGSFIYGSGRASSNTASSNTTTTTTTPMTMTGNTTGSGSLHSATPKHSQTDPRYRAEAVIEVDQKRPFSIESTKSAPDVIATH